MDVFIHSRARNTQAREAKLAASQAADAGTAANSERALHCPHPVPLCRAESAVGCVCLFVYLFSPLKNIFGILAASPRDSL